MSLNKTGRPRESKVMKVVNMAGTVVMLNLMFLLACLPVVTMGPALCGLFSGVRYMIRGDGPARGFWEGFKTRLVRMMIMGVILTAIIVYFVIILNQAYNTWVEFGVYRDLIIQGAFAMIPMMLLIALAALNIYIPYDAGDWLTNGVNMIFKAPIWMLLAAVMFGLPVVFMIAASDLLILAIVGFVGFWFAVTAFVTTMNLKNALIDMLLEFKDEHPELYEEEADEEEEEEE